MWSGGQIAPGFSKFVHMLEVYKLSGLPNFGELPVVFAVPKLLLGELLVQWCSSESFGQLLPAQQQLAMHKPG